MTGSRSQAEIEQTPDAQREWLATLIEGDYDYKRLKRGEIREATILSIDENQVIVDLGVKRDGIVPSRDLQLLDDAYRNSLQVGERVPISILSTSPTRNRPAIARGSPTRTSVPSSRSVTNPPAQGSRDHSSEVTASEASTSPGPASAGSIRGLSGPQTGPPSVRA